ncbi:MAG: UvrD-helicase domain-containing protein, partial [Pseudomonadota bacterium]
MEPNRKSRATAACDMDDLFPSFEPIEPLTQSEASAGETVEAIAHDDHDDGWPGPRGAPSQSSSSDDVTGDVSSDVPGDVPSGATLGAPWPELPSDADREIAFGVPDGPITGTQPIPAPPPPPQGLSISERALGRQAAPDYLATLNPEQRRAVETLDGPVLVLAGAGTGKTKALTTRIAHILNTGGADPREILSVTFTNKAAREMRERVAGHLGAPGEGLPWLGTFHSICVKLLRRHAELVGLKSNFTILDTDDQIRLLKQL